MANRFDEYHENPGMGLAAAVAAICIGPIVAFSPSGQRAYKAVTEALRQDVTVSKDYANRADTESMYAGNELYRGYNTRK